VFDLNVEAAYLGIHVQLEARIGSNECRPDALELLLQAALLGGTREGLDLFLGPAPAFGKVRCAAQVEALQLWQSSFLSSPLPNSFHAPGRLAVTAGYTYFEHLPWRDAFLNSAMLMGGMGPVDTPRTDGGKLFAGVYALYAGLVLLVGAGLIFAPVVHRVMHKFHWEQ
jgi:hypothetical protein